VKKKTDPFVQVPLWWITEATRLTRTPGALVCIHLLYAAWKAKSLTFTLSNGRLKKCGVNRETKRRVLRDLEAGGLIKVERRPGRAPVVTLLIL
jgi:hypothetical protein